MIIAVNLVHVPTHYSLPSVASTWKSVLPRDAALSRFGTIARRHPGDI